jgi:hypothetical protein
MLDGSTDLIFLMVAGEEALAALGHCQPAPREQMERLEVRRARGISRQSG